MSCQTVDGDTRNICSRRMSEGAESKRQRTRSSLKEKTRGSSTLKPEVQARVSGTEKVRISIVQSPRKSIVTSPSNSVKSSFDQSPDTAKLDDDNKHPAQPIDEEPSETVIVAQDPALVSPPQKLAHMINLLQELEDSKSDPATDDSTTVPSKEEKYADIEKEIPEKDVQAPEEVVGEAVQETTEAKQDAVEEIEDKIEQLKPPVKEVVETAESNGDNSNERRDTSDAYKLSTRQTVAQSIDSEVTVSENSADENTADKFERDKSKVDDAGLPRASVNSKKEMSVITPSTPRPSMETQASDADHPTVKAKTSSFLKKKNKVEPYQQVNADTDVQIWSAECQNEPGTPAMCKEVTERFLADKQGLLGEMPICPSCKKIQYFAVSPSYYYYSVYRDKAGRLFCDNCASKNAIKVLYKHNPSEQTFLKCARCGTLLRPKTTRSEYFRNRNENCPKCIKMHGRVHSTMRK